MKIALLIHVLLWAQAGQETATCPSNEAVAQALSPALSRARGQLAVLPPDVRVVDLGDAYEVTAGGQVQRYTDAARDCVERARVAAVFIALALSPPAVVRAAPPPPPPPPPEPPVTTPAPRGAIAINAAARFDAAAGGGADTTGGVALGGEAQLRLGRRALGVEVTAGVLSATDTLLGSVHVREQRFPCSVAATLRGQLGARLELAGALGLSVTPLTLHGQGLMTSNAVTRLDFGPRLAVGVRLAGHSVAPFAAVHLEYFPRTYVVAVDPLGQVGTTAPLQLGASIGLAWDVPRRR